MCSMSLGGSRVGALASFVDTIDIKHLYLPVGTWVFWI